MRYLFALILPLSLLTLQGCDQLQTPHDSATGSGSSIAPAGPVMATVNGKPLTQPVFEAYAAQRRAASPGGEGSDNAAILEELINLELMRQEGVNKGLEAKPAVAALLDQQQRAVLARAAIQDFTATNPVTDEMAKQLYDTQLGAPGKEYKASHILVETQDEAVAIIAELDGGANFAELAKSKSTGPSGPSGGQLGWFSPAQMVPPFSQAAAQLEKGSYSKEPVETQFGWHVILLEDSRESTPPAFDEVKDRLKLAMANKLLQQHLQEVRAAADVTITASEEPASEEPAAEDSGEPAAAE
jgi:peptidyl-prolyl cis-trans isomerase C